MICYCDTWFFDELSLEKVGEHPHTLDILSQPPRRETLSVTSGNHMSQGYTFLRDIILVTSNLTTQLITYIF